MLLICAHAWLLRFSSDHALNPPLFTGARSIISRPVASASSDVYGNVTSSITFSSASTESLATSLNEPLPFLDKIIDTVPKYSLQELLHHYEDFLMYAITDCPICIFYPRPDGDVHPLDSPCRTLEPDRKAHETFVGLLRNKNLPLCTFCFLSLDQYHENRDSHTVCRYPDVVSTVAFFLWNHPPTLELVLHILVRTFSLEIPQTGLSMDIYVDVLAVRVEKVPLLILVIGLYWHLYDKNVFPALG